MLGKLFGGLTTAADSMVTLARAGLIRPERPDTLARVGIELARRGPLALVVGAGALRYGDRTAFVDELGGLSYRDLDRRSNALANAWIEAGIQPGEGIAILARNHRGFVDALFAAAKAGLRIVLVNTEFAGPQIADVCERENLPNIVFDAEYEDRVPRLRRRFRAWGDGEPAGELPDLEQLIAAGSPEPVSPPGEPPELVLLTSGTTGAPKGAARSQAGSITNLTAMLERVPFRARESTYVAPPCFHALGLGTLIMGIGFGSTVVTARRFDAAAVLDGIERHSCTALIAVPAMLQRILALGPEEISARDHSSLRIILSSGSQLPGPVASELLEAFGDVLHVLYGSTEVAYVTISTPADHRAAPASVGRPVRGVELRLLDDDGEGVPRGETGRIFVSTGLEFSGYTDGGGKEVIDGYMASGDLGHLDAGGRLHIDGRDDDMIVSGGENVFPQEVEELLIAAPGVADVAVAGVEDERFGQRLAAWVVAAPGAAPTEDELRSYVGARLARFKVPRDIHLVGELPRNATGKILKRQLREPGGV
ncbi:MAG TPA: AMP-binding protein [Solirubrobacterales bacterium]|nr:AMP-binding protein [Solirubrobacterales bacterium]